MYVEEIHSQNCYLNSFSTFDPGETIGNEKVTDGQTDLQTDKFKAICPLLFEEWGGHKNKNTIFMSLEFHVIFVFVNLPLFSNEETQLSSTNMRFSSTLIHIINFTR